MESLAALGFNVVGYGCTTCVGNSGPLPERVAATIMDSNIIATAVLSGNRNFEGRINPLVKANYLASPPLVIAYALAGTTDIDLINEPLGIDHKGEPVFLRELWPSQEEIDEVIAYSANPDIFRRMYRAVDGAHPGWDAISHNDQMQYLWSESSTYIQRPPFFKDMSLAAPVLHDIRNARMLALFGDNITTDHISPAGSISPHSPAGRYLAEHGVAQKDFNQYGTRRGNDQIMVRGTFANIRLKNLMMPDIEGGLTVHYPDGIPMPIFDAAMQYQREGTSLVVVAGKEYGTGSSRDWAAKGTALLGVRAVLAESFERTHRSNLVGMGVLPLQFDPDQNAATLGLTGNELITIKGLRESIMPRHRVTVKIEKPDGNDSVITATARLDTPIDVEYYTNGGILPTVLRHLFAAPQI